MLADALGGSIKLPASAVCKVCNNRLNREVDTPVQRDLLPLLALLTIPGKYGQTPRWTVEETVNGEKRRIEIDKDSVRPAETLKLISKTSTEYAFRASSREELERVRKEIADKNPGKTVVLTIDGPVDIELPEGRVDHVDFNVAHWPRWAAKTALNAICYTLGAGAALDVEFDLLRAFALGEGPQPDGLRMGGSGDDIQYEDELVAEHEVTVLVASGEITIRARLFGFCGMEVKQTTSRTVHYSRRIVLDAGEKRLVSDTQ